MSCRGAGVGSGVVDFETVARRQNGGLGDLTRRADFVTRSIPISFGNRKLFSYFNRGVVDRKTDAVGLEPLGGSF